MRSSVEAASVSVATALSIWLLRLPHRGLGAAIFGIGLHQLRRQRVLGQPRQHVARAHAVANLGQDFR